MTAEHKGRARTRVAAAVIGGVTLLAPTGASAQSLPATVCEGTAGAGSFTDVNAGSPHAAAIDCLVARNITQGRTATSFQPGGALSRGQAASMIVRTIQMTATAIPVSQDWFTDDETSVHEDNLNKAAEVGVLRGVRPGTAAPGANLSRAQAATLLVRMYEMAFGALPAPTSDRFTDDNGSIHEVNINKAAALGLVQGVSATSFAPHRPIQRDEAASLIARTAEAMYAKYRTSRGA